MTAHTYESNERLDSLIRRLDENMSVLIAGERRRQPRRLLRYECDAHLFYGPDLRFCTVEGMVRNVTFDGVSVISGLTEPILVGRPVEVHVPFLGGPLTFLAGTVVYCRHVDDGCHEIGVLVQASSSDPILTQDAQAARDRYAWFAEALQVRQDSTVGQKVASQVVSRGEGH